MRAGAGRTNLELPDTIFPIENFRYLHDDLGCRVIILEQQESLVFVSLDLTSLQEYAIDAIKTEISSHYAVPLNHIFISVSHTFSAP
ncbi:alkaline ceramidase, partial [Bacillus thuringiensis]|nr:alkaline ceramidase [Bacillus thuringiensis]